MITERILEILDLKGITKYKFCKDMEFSNAFLDKPREITTDKYANILYYFPDVSPEWLLTGKGEMLKSEEILNIVNRSEEIPESIPLYNVMASAGFGTFEKLLTEENIIGRYNIPDLKADFMMYVKGNSMYPKYSNKDIIGCKQIYERNFIQWNKPHVIATREQGILVKRIQEGQQKDFIVAVSDNKDYPPINIPNDEILDFAIVTGVIRLE